MAMNVFKLSLYNLRQRLLSAVLTGFLVALGVGLVAGIRIVQRQAESSFKDSVGKFHLLVGPKGSAIQLLLNACFHLDKPVGNLSYEFYDDLRKRPEIAEAWPMAMGDNYQGFHIVGTERGFLERFEHRPGETFRIAAGGRLFERDFEAVLGSEVAESAGLQVGDHFEATHGVSETSFAGAKHDHRAAKVVGILEPTATPHDRAIFCSLETVWFLHENNPKKPAGDANAKVDHDHDGHDHHHHEPFPTPSLAGKLVSVAHDRKHVTVELAGAKGSPAGRVEVALPAADKLHWFNLDRDEDEQLKVGYSIYVWWEKGSTHKAEMIMLGPKKLAAVLVLLKNTHVQAFLADLHREINNGKEAMAVYPTGAVGDLFQIVGRLNQVVEGVSLMVLLSAAVSILAAMYNSMAERRREIAIVRALGSPAGTVFRMIVLESAVICVLGSLGGLAAAYLLLWGAGPLVRQSFGVIVHLGWPGLSEFALVGGAVVLGILAALLPAAVGYRTDVSTNLRPSN